MANSSISKTTDLFGFGIAAVDDLLEVPEFPRSGAKMQVLSSQRQGGGLCATALVAAARLGMKCAYGGLLGGGDLSTFTRHTLEREGIRVSPIAEFSQAEPYHSVIFVDSSTGERTILFSRENVIEPGPEHIREETILSSRMLFVDHSASAATLKACRIARANGIPIISDIERMGDPMLMETMELIGHMIVSLDFARQLTGCESPEPALTKLSRPQRICTAVTAGAKGCWFIDCASPDRIRYQPAFRVPVVDTTGCGDVFHGAYAAAILLGQGVADAIRFASAAAALKAGHAGAQQGCPNLSQVEDLL